MAYTFAEKNERGTIEWGGVLRQLLHFFYLKITVGYHEFMSMLSAI